MEILPVDLIIAMISSIVLCRYHVIKEYTILPALPPPLNVFGRSLSPSSCLLANLSHDQIEALRRREALAYESIVLEQFIHDKSAEKNHRENFDSDLRYLKKLTSHVKITCEAWTENVL